MELTIIELKSVSFATNKLDKCDVMRICPVCTSFFIILTMSWAIDEMFLKR